jgi:outer membrane protein assembly factor BamB
MKSKLRPALFIVVLIALLGVVLVGCRGASPQGWSGPVVSQGVLYLGSMEGKLFALDANTGNAEAPSVEIKVSGGGVSFGCAPSTTGSALYSTAVVSSDMLYIGDYDGNMRAYNLKLVAGWGGKMYKTGGHIVGSPVLADGYLYFGSSDKKVYALDAATGQLRPGWPFKTEGKVWSTPAIVDGVVYIGSLDHHLYAIKADTGEIVPGFNFKANGAIITTPIIQGETIYIGANDGYLYALNRADGTVRWKFKGNRWFWAQPVLSGDTIYAVTLKGTVYAIKDSGSQGTELWHYDLDAGVSASPLLAQVGGEESLLVGDHDGYLHVVSTDEALPLNIPRDRPVKFEGAIYAPLGISEDQTIVYIYTRNHELHAMELATEAPKWTYDTDNETLKLK